MCVFLEEIAQQESQVVVILRVAWVALYQGCLVIGEHGDAVYIDDVQGILVGGHAEVDLVLQRLFHNKMVALVIGSDINALHGEIDRPQYFLVALGSGRFSVKVKYQLRVAALVILPDEFHGHLEAEAERRHLESRKELDRAQPLVKAQNQNPPHLLVQVPYLKKREIDLCLQSLDQLLQVLDQDFDKIRRDLRNVPLEGCIHALLLQLFWAELERQVFGFLKTLIEEGQSGVHRVRVVVIRQLSIAKVFGGHDAPPLLLGGLVIHHRLL